MEIKHQINISALIMLPIYREYRYLKYRSIYRFADISDLYFLGGPSECKGSGFPSTLAMSCESNQIKSNEFTEREVRGQDHFGDASQYHRSLSVHHPSG